MEQYFFNEESSTIYGSNTNASEDAIFDAYESRFAKYKRISKEREFELARRIQNGDKSAVEELIGANSGFIMKKAREYAKNLKGRCIEVEDIIGNVFVGATIAAFKFDPSKDAKFITFAADWIKKYAIEGLNSSSTIKVADDALALMKEYKKYCHYTEQTGGFPDVYDFCDDRDIDVDVLLKAFGVKSIASLDDAIYDEDDDDATTIGAQVADPYQDDIDVWCDIRSASERANMLLFSALKPRDLEIFNDLMKNDEKPGIVAKKHEIGVERVRQIRVKGTDILANDKLLRELWLGEAA